MNTLTTLGEVRQRVLDMGQECYDDLVPVKDMKFESLESVRIGSQEHHLRVLAQRCLAYRFGVPFHYLEKCPPEVQAFNLNHWLEKERNEKLFIRFDGEEVRAVFTPRYVPVDNYDVLGKLGDLGYGDDVEVQSRLDEEFMLLNIPDRKTEFSVDLKGVDKMRSGLSIGNSEVGLRSLSISAFILRLVCTNGLIGTRDVTVSYRHISSKVLERFPEVLEGTVKELGVQRHQLGLSLRSPVSDPQQTMKTFNLRFQLGKVEQDAVEWAWPQERGETMFNVVNAYTRAAQYPELCAESSFRLQRVGGMILGLVN